MSAPVTALAIDGPARGKVVTIQRDPWVFVRPANEEMQQPVAAVEIKRVTYRLEQFRVGPRYYWMLMSEPAPDADAALCALIDCDPAAARQCQLA